MIFDNSEINNNNTVIRGRQFHCGVENKCFSFLYRVQFPLRFNTYDTRVCKKNLYGTRTRIELRAKICLQN